MSHALLAGLAWALAPLVAAAIDPRTVVRESIARERRGVDLQRDYVYRYTDLERKFDGAGKVVSASSRTYEVSTLYGRQFVREVERDGKPLAGAEREKVAAAFGREVERRRRLSPEERERQDAREREKRLRQTEFLEQVPDLFDFELLREQVVDGRPAWVIAARPRPAARPRGIAAHSLAKLSGTLWIDEAERQWVRVQAEAETPVTFGLLFGSLGPGSTILFEQTRVNDEVWLPKRTHGRLKARILVKHFNVETDTTYFDYRRFQTGTRVIATTTE